jgi:hypothetical protein
MAQSIFRIVAALVIGVGIAIACQQASDRGGSTSGMPPWPTSLDGPPFNDQSWNQPTGNGWSYLRRGSSRDDDIVTDATAPASPPHVLRIIFTPGMGRDREPSVHWIGLPNPKEVSAAWWMKLSANWTPSPAGAGKISFLHATPSGAGHVYIGLFGSTAPHRVSVNTEWAPYGQRVWDPNVNTTPIVYDRWYRVKWHVKWASPGASDGILRWWVDDVLNGEYTSITYPSAGSGFQQFEFAPTLQNPPPAEQYMYIDHTRIGGR